MNKNLILVLVLIVLVVVSVFQAVQLTGLKAKVESGALKVGSSSGNIVTQTSTSSSGAVPSNLQNLPSQVGGC